MSKYRLVSLLTFLLLLIPFSKVNAQETLPGLQYSCLQAQWCTDDDAECSTNHVHRVQLTTDPEFTATPSSPEAYVTECIEVVNAATNTPETICTTGSTALDQELFCGADNPDPSSCDFFTELKNNTGYTLSAGESYGTYYYNSTSQEFEKKDPMKISTDAQGTIVPSKIEWQSRTNQTLTRRFLVWTRVNEGVGTIGSVDAGQKQATLSFPDLSDTCQGVTWDPEGIVFDAQTGIPLGDVSLAINYSEAAAGPFTKATSGLDAVLPPGTDNPLMSTAAGFYRFYGAEGYYTIVPQHGVYQHMADKQVTIPASVAKIYPTGKNYYSNSKPIYEKAGTRQVKNIPLVVKPGQQRPQFVFQVLSSVINTTPRGAVEITGRVNAPATLVLEICSNLSGIPNCRAKKEYAPGAGGPSPDNNFSYSISAKQTDLQAGENFKVSFEPLTVNPVQTKTSPIMKHIQKILSALVPEVSAQESTVSFTVEPIPTYLEGFAYDSTGHTIPNAMVSIYVSFSPRPLYQVQANENGFFRITSNHLPKNPYTVTYTTADGSKVSVTTSQFLAQNNEFMQVEKVNPYQYVTESTNPRATVTPSFQPRSADTGSMAPTAPAGTAASPAPAEGGQPQTGTSPYFLIFMGIIGIAVVGIAVTLYMMKRKSSPTI